MNNQIIQVLYKLGNNFEQKIHKLDYPQQRIQRLNYPLKNKKICVNLLVISKYLDNQDLCRLYLLFNQLIEIRK